MVEIKNIETHIVVIFITDFNFTLILSCFKVKRVVHFYMLDSIFLS